jgi:predicted PhzF superfamily epimerase YddE/YHI9
MREVKAMTRIYQVDAFTTDAFKGNPAGVCLLTEERPASWMQAIAAEMNVSETVFVQNIESDFSVRYFTPTVEVPLCGHATLSAAHVLWSEGIVAPRDRILFHAQEEDLAAEMEGGWICMDFPAWGVKNAETPAGLAEALETPPVAVYATESDGCLVELPDERAVGELQPDMGRLRAVDAQFVCVTARSGTGEFDFVSRFFAPKFGIDEDPVTGTAHCMLGPFWQSRLNKAELVGHQVSARGGVVRVRMAGQRVKILGQAVSVFKGTLDV